jgi:magnesium chelatase family protein
MGIDAHPLEVEVDISRGLPGFSIVGLPREVVKEGKERVCAAIRNTNYEFPPRKLTINLAPADIYKDGSALDFPLAMGILLESSQVPPDLITDYILVGELSLDGKLKPVRGALSIALMALRCGFKGVLLPRKNAMEAALVKGIDILPVERLLDCIHWAQRKNAISSYAPGKAPSTHTGSEGDADFRDILAQDHAKRALEIAAAGGHNILMIGPPGSGKTMLAKRVPSILPPLSFEEAIVTTKIHSVSSLLPPHRSLLTTRPFRAPHHTITMAGLIGGRLPPRPGEVSLAHNGVLFLDELSEFRRDILEVLRQPMEDEQVTISRANISLTFPASFMLVAAMNPCPCGNYTDPRKKCNCTPRSIERYLSRISGPLLDRIDLQIEVPSLPCREMLQDSKGESSAEILKRVTRASNVEQ